MSVLWFVTFCVDIKLMINHYLESLFLKPELWDEKT